VGICGGLITAISWVIWAVKVVIRMCKACRKPSAEECKFSTSMLMDLMGDARSMEHPRAQGVRFTKGRS